MKIKKKRAFTLMEILVVISIIIILAGFLAPAVSRAREQAKKQKTKAMIGSLETAVSMYYTDWGEYPANLSRLRGNISYMENKDYQGGQFINPWGVAYNYTTSANQNSYTISTNTPDGEVIRVQHP